MGMGNIANSGMQAAMSDMEVISNNVANAGTDGFKKSTANFSDLFPSESGNASGNVQIGLGVTLSNIEQNFDPAGFRSTDTASDIYVPGRGFLVTRDSLDGGISYTRLGNFRFNNASGYFSIGNRRLQGFPAVNGTVPSGGSIADLQVDVNSQPAKASTSLSFQNINIDSGSAVIPGTTVFSPTDTSSYNYSSNATLFDSQGNKHTLSLYYAKTASNTWSVYAVMDNSNVLNGSSPGSLVFDTSGKLTSATGLNAFSWSPSTGAAPMNFAADLSNITQFASANNSGESVTDGTAAGSFNGYSINSDGLITASYSNGATLQVGKIAIANFQNPSGLQNHGSGTWTATTTSGNAVINQSNSTGNIRQKALEVSNVDIATELVNLTSAQNSFQANAQVEEVYNHIMETVTKL